MQDKTINEMTSFENKIKSFSLEQLEDLQNSLNEQIGKMVWNDNLVQQIALVQTLIDERKK